jgi:ATP-dependent DNA helicase DinG
MNDKEWFDTDNTDLDVAPSGTTIKLKYKPRGAQVEMLGHFTSSVKSNKKFILLDSPVGTGKSFGAMLMMDWFKRNYDPGATFDILTNSKILQEQYTRDFEFINSLWGRESYQCEKFSCGCSTGQKMGQLTNNACEICPYKIAKNDFFHGEVSLTNFHLFTTYMLFVANAWEKVRKSRVLIIDEAHEFDNVFCDFITTSVSKRSFKKVGIDQDTTDRLYNAAIRCYDVKEYHRTAIDVVIPNLKSFSTQLKKDISAKDPEEAAKLIERADALDQLIGKWDKFVKEYEDDPDNWVLERQEYETESGKKEMDVTVQPVWSRKYLKEIWDKYDFVVMMSGTLLDKDLFCWMNGIDRDEASYLSIPSPFPAKNRPIYYMPVGKMNFKNKDKTFSEQLPWLKKIMEKHSNHKGIVHTVNYELAQWTTDGLNDGRLLPHNSTNRQNILDAHCASKQPTVLVSPSMINGVDLKEDLSRFQVLLKMPYPNLKSEKVKKRMETNGNWYSWKTCCDIIQSYGRSIRSEEDTAATYIIDSCFGDIMKYSMKYLPEYFREAIIHVNI